MNTPNYPTIHPKRDCARCEVTAFKDVSWTWIYWCEICRPALGKQMDTAIQGIVESCKKKDDTNRVEQNKIE